METHEVTEKVNNKVYKCPGCGANLTYDSETSTMSCDYCDYKLKLEGETSQEEFDLNDAEDSSWEKEAKVVRCQNCGANNVIDAAAITNLCPFCGSAAVVDTNDIVGARPNRVIPFKVSSKQAISNYQVWLKKRFFAPRKVKKELPNPLLNGVYEPSWTYDTETFTKYKGRLGKRYTVVVGSGKNRRTEVRIRWFSISGVHQQSLDDILISSGKKIAQKEIDKLSPYNTNDSYLYDSRYLAGFYAEHYDLTREEGWEKAKVIGKERIKNAILSGYSYDVVDYIDLDVTFDKIKYKYVLIPVWICLFMFNRKQYNFCVNGETGKVVGKYPISILKIILLVLLILLITSIILIFCALFEGWQ